MSDFHSKGRAIDIALNNVLTSHGDHLQQKMKLNTNLIKEDVGQWR